MQLEVLSPGMNSELKRGGVGWSRQTEDRPQLQSGPSAPRGPSSPPYSLMSVPEGLTASWSDDTLVVVVVVVVHFTEV